MPETNLPAGSNRRLRLFTIALYLTLLLACIASTVAPSLNR
jgi:hypothetical protein